MLRSGSTTRINRVIFPNLKRSTGALCLGLAAIFLLAVFMSGCVVHSPGHHGKRHLRGHGHGHHKAKIKIKPHAEIRVSPFIVIDD